MCLKIEYFFRKKIYFNAIFKKNIFENVSFPSTICELNKLNMGFI